MKKTSICRHTASLATLLLMLFLTNCNNLRAARVGVYCYLAADGTHTYADQHLRARLLLSPDGAALIEVQNLTDSILYIDRGNSFAYVNGESEPFHIPSASTESQAYMEGIIRDNGWGTATFEGTQQGRSHTVYDRRTQPIAPRGRAIVYVWDDLPRFLRQDMIYTDYRGRSAQSHKGMFLTGSTEIIGGDPTIFVPTTQEKFRRGTRRDYAPDATPLALAADFQYTFADPTLPPYATVPDNAAKPLHARLSDYVASIVIGDFHGISSDGILVAPQASGSHCFAFRNGTNHAATIAGCAALAGLVVAAVALNADDFGSMPDFPY